MPNPHPLALAYLRAFAEAHHARGHVVPTGMPSPAMQMHRARDAWQKAGCPLEVWEVPSPKPEPVAVPCRLAADDGWTGPGVVLRVTPRHLFVAPPWGVGPVRTRAYSRKTGWRIYWPNVRVINHKDVAAEWLRANGGGA